MTLDNEQANHTLGRYADFAYVLVRKRSLCKRVFLP
jgi:hypothetical protein